MLNLSIGRRPGVMAILLMIFGVIGLPGGGAALASEDPVTIQIVEETFHYSGDSEIVVQILLTGAAGAAGIDFTLEYPEDRVSSLPEYGNGDLFTWTQANTAIPGRVLFAAAGAQGLVTPEGVLCTLTFQVPCQGNAQEYPDGRPMGLQFTEFLVFDEASVAMDGLSVDGNITLNCDQVANDATSFGCLKSLFGASGSEE